MQQAGCSPTSYACSKELLMIASPAVRILGSIRPVNFQIGSLIVTELLTRADHLISR